MRAEGPVDTDSGRIVQTTPWPDPPASEAYDGLAGDIVRMLEPHSEADPVAILTQTLTAFGNCIGRLAHYLVESDTHPANLFMVLVATSSKGRKGTSWGRVRETFRAVEPEWAEGRQQAGLSSGEGLIWAVRDEIKKQEPIRENRRVIGYEEIVSDPGEKDKRLLVVESEFASTLKVMAREGNTLSPVIRQAWDVGDLKTLTKNSPARATGAHISIIGHVTKPELLRYLDSTEMGNGFANRFLWVCAKRSKLLPEGGSLSDSDLNGLIVQLRRAVLFARNVNRLRRDDDARQAWHALYGALSEGKPGLLGAITSRAEAQVTRLSVIYALLDGSAVIKPAHLTSALALWEYCEASAGYIFGNALGDPVADALLRMLKEQPAGLTRTEIRDLFGRNKNATEIDRGLNVLLELGLAHTASEESGGRPAQRWFASRADGLARGRVGT